MQFWVKCQNIKKVTSSANQKGSSLIGMEAFVNPFTAEDYRQWRRGDILCGHNLWIRNTVPSRQRRFLAVVYPAPQGQAFPVIERLDDATVRVANDIVSFDPDSPYAQNADLIVDTSAMAREVGRDLE